jgi:hypothetical protein
VDILSNDAVGSITINNNASTLFGGLTVGTYTITTTGDFLLQGTGVFGNVDVNGGVINAGGAFIFNDGRLSLSSGILNVGTYLNYQTGTLVASADVDFRISVNGVRNDDTNPSIYVDRTASITLNAADITLTLENLNTGTAKEIELGNFPSNGTGDLNILLNNADAISNDICYVQSDVTIDNLGININKAPAENNTLQLNRTDGQPFVLSDVSLSNTPMITSDLEITNSLTIDFLSSLNVNGTLNSTATNELTADGALLVSNALLLKSNITGVGLVEAAMYDYDNGTYSIFGIQPSAGQKAAGSTWFGEANSEWFNDDNWNDGKNNSTPGGNSYVLISTDFIAGTWPSISTTNAEGAVVELTGTAATLLINSGGELIVREKGSSGKDGVVLIGQGAGLTVLGGNMTVEIDMNIGGTLSVSSNGQVQVNRNVDVDTGGFLNIQEGSTFTIGQQSK